MPQKPKKRMVIKIGTNVLTNDRGEVDEQIIHQLVAQVATIKAAGHQVVLVSSGAVGVGRSAMPVSKTLSKVVSRQVFAAIGQPRLMNMYTESFQQHQLHCAQVLATKEDFRDRTHYNNMQQCFLALLRDSVIPIANENDVISISELMFTDNDELAGLIAAMINADLLIILSNVDGIYDGPPDQSSSKVIARVGIDDRQVRNVITPSRSSFGRGGMLTKFRMARKAASVGIDTFIANGKKANILTDILEGRTVGTHFVASNRLSGVKKWIAFNEQAEKASVLVNQGAADRLRSSEKVSSLLPVGIIDIEGTFKKGDLLRVLDKDRQVLAIGLAQYGDHTARQYLGQKGKKPLIHYDYLLIE